MSNRRVVVTGIGTINPLGDNIAEYFANLEKGVSAAAPITSFDAHNFKTRFACEIKNYDWARYFDRKEVRKYDRYTQYAMIAVAEAMQDSALEVAEDEAERIGVVWSTGVGGLGSFFEEVMDYAAGDGTPRFSPFFCATNDSRSRSGIYLHKVWTQGPELLCDVSVCFCKSRNDLCSGSDSMWTCRRDGYRRLGGYD